MNTTDQTLQTIDRMIRKVAEKFPAQQEATMMTDIHLRVNQESGELVAFDDDDNEVTRCVVEQWIDNKDDGFYDDVAAALHKRLGKHRQLIDNMSILKPFSFVLEDDERENCGELYVADDDTVIINPELMAGLDKDLDDFLKKLLKK